MYGMNEQCVRNKNYIHFFNNFFFVYKIIYYNNISSLFRAVMDIEEKKERKKYTTILCVYRCYEFVRLQCWRLDLVKEKNSEHMQVLCPQA